MNILFYTPTNNISRDQESLALAASKHGHKVFLLIENNDGPLADIFRKHGFSVTTRTPRPPNSRTLIPLVLDLVTYCRRNKIDVAYSYIEPTNFISVFAQYFTRTKFILYRHHTDAALLDGFDKSLAYRTTYRRAKNIIVVSAAAYRYATLKENIPATKVHHINLGYDFTLFDVPVSKNKIAGRITLALVGRLTSYKRPLLSLLLLKELLNRGNNVHLVIMGEGEMRKSIEGSILEMNLQDHVTMTGYVLNVLPHLASSDFLIHPSITESSCVAIKEAALVETPAIVCKGVGDFDDVITNGVSGWLVDRENFVGEAVKIIEEHTIKQDALIGRRLKEKVMDFFSIESTYPLHDKLYAKLK